MNPWTLKEILQIIPLYPKLNEPFSKKLFERLGPTPRICIDYQRNDNTLEQYETSVVLEINHATKEQLWSLLKSVSALDMDDVSHTFALVSRESLHHVFSKVIISPITPAIKLKLAVTFRYLTVKDRIELYLRLSSDSRSMALGGVVFESIGQDLIYRGTTLAIFPMVKLDSTRSRLYSSHQLLQGGDSNKFSDIGSEFFLLAQVELLPNPTLNNKRLSALSNVFSKDIKPSRMEEFDGNGLSITENVFYIPSAVNQKVFDSFIALGDELFIFQFTAAKTHDMKPGLIEFFQGCTSVPALEKWMFVFIIDNQILTCPQRGDVSKLRMYSATMDVKKHPLFEPHIGGLSGFISPSTSGTSVGMIPGPSNQDLPPTAGSSKRAAMDQNGEMGGKRKKQKQKEGSN